MLRGSFRFGAARSVSGGPSMSESIRVAILGATGYTGAELARLLLSHPRAQIVEMVGHGKAGQPIAAVLPSLAGLLEGDVLGFDADRIAKSSDAIFSCLPHGASAKLGSELRSRG